MTKLHFTILALLFFLFIGYTTHLWIEAMPTAPVSTVEFGHLMYLINSR